MDSTQPNLEALTTILSALKTMSREEQHRTLNAVAVFLGLNTDHAHQQSNNAASSSPVRVLYSSAAGKSSFSEDRSLSAKDFLRDKKPASDIERVACLGYYLSHYGEMPHFKTVDISALNTEAAQPKFSNASMAVDNATKAGLLVPAVKGSKQLSSAGENYVQLLPDRDAAKEGLKSEKLRRKPRRSTLKKIPAIIKEPSE